MLRKAANEERQDFLEQSFEGLEQAFEGPPVYDTDTEEEGWNEGPPVYDTDTEEEGWNDAIDVNSEFQNEDVVVTNRNQKKKEDEPEKENEEEVKPEVETILCSRNRSEQCSSLATEQRDLDARKKESRPEKKLEEVDLGGADMEPLTEEPPPEPPEPPDGGVFQGGSRSLGVGKRDGGDQKPSSEGSSPEGNAGGAATGGRVAMEEFAFSLAVGGYGCDTERVEEIRVGWKSRMDRVVISLGQAQLLVNNVDYSYIKWGVLKVAREIKNNNPHLCAILACAFRCNWEPKNTNMSSEASQVHHSMEKQAEVLVTEVPNADYVTQTSPTSIWDKLFIFPPLQQLTGLSFMIKAFMALLDLYSKDSGAPLVSLQDHKKLVESQSCNHINPWEQNEFEISKEAIELLKEEVNISGGAKCKWHKLMVEHFSQMVKYPLVYKWDPGGIQQDESIMESAITCHRNQTPHNQQGAPFNNEERCLKIASDTQNKKLRPSVHEFLNWNQCIGADISVAKGRQGLHVGIIPGMYTNSLHIENVLLHHHLVTKISSYNPPLLPNTMKAWHEKSTKGFKYSSHNKSAELEDESNIQGVGVMLLELIIGRTPKKANDVEAFKSLLQASRGVDKEAWRSNVDPKICKAYLAQSLKALIEICVEHLIQGSESLRMAMAETHHKQWDPGEPYSVSCIIETSCFQLWDPGGRPSSLPLSRHLHLEDKVNFEGGSIDENLDVAELGQTNRFGRVYSRRGKRGNVPK